MGTKATAPGSVTVSTIDPRLRAYIQRIWLNGPSGESPVSVTLGSAPDTHIVAETYAIVPHARAARFLVPMGARAASAAAFGTYNATRAPLSRTLRGVVGRGYDYGVSDRLFPQRLTISVDRRFPQERWDEVLFIRHLADVLGIASVRAFTAIRKINPNVKPTLALFDELGRPAGYAKLGTTEATRRLVRIEASAMAELSGQLEAITVPRLLDSGDWGAAAYTVSDPLPRDLHRWTWGPEATTQAMKTIAASGAVSRTQLAGSSYAARLRADIDRVGVSDEVARTLAQWLERLERDGSTLGYGRLHGDWIPDNLGRSDSQFVVWDWEHSHRDAPVGFDLLHWHFHDAFVRHGMHAGVAALDAAAPRLAALGVAPHAQRLVASLYLLDVFVRRAKLAVGGGGWNQRWYPHLLEVARTRDLL